ncbi:unnamed protein product [Rodentolepis nana]|uniref:SHSP domain-containing protein n=1 Tax=Rodentolepis nana TaxID=102285 RepID=A0A0R3T5W8_RODNA|nr:unnamed protein product [Rodentolepis nana]
MSTSADGSISSPHDGRIRRQGSSIRRDVQTIFIDSEVMKGKSARHYQRSRSHSLVRGRRSRSGQQSPRPVYYEPEMIQAPSGTYRYRACSTDSSISSSLSSSTTDSSISSTIHRSTSSSSSDSSIGDTSRVKIIRVNQNSEPDYVDDGRVFVFDSKKHRIVEVPSRQGPHYQHFQRLSRQRRDRKLGWTMDGLSIVAYPGKETKKSLYMLQ